MNDGELVFRCVQGETAAWEELYERFHPGLLAAIRQRLGQRAADVDLVGELAARVWYDLVRNQAECLTKYKPHQGSLAAFLRGFARNHLRAFYRAERRRVRREAQASAPSDAQDANPGLSEAQFHEFLHSLSNRERQYVDACAGGENLAENGFSANAGYQMGFRLRRKIRRYFGSSEQR